MGFQYSAQCVEGKHHNMKNRYEKNFDMLSEAEMLLLLRSRVCVIGCGGLGGHIVEQLARLGVGNITVVDGDVFVESNLNRQLFSTTETLGKSKAESAVTRIVQVNPDINILPVTSLFTEENSEEIIKNHQVVVDAVDNITTRLLLQKKCEELGIPLVHGAIAGWYGQVTTIFPGDRTLDFLFKSSENYGIEKQLGNPSFTPAIVASIQVSEVLKIIIKRGELLRKRILYIDLLEQEYIHINI